MALGLRAIRHGDRLQICAEGACLFFEGPGEPRHYIHGPIFRVKGVVGVFMRTIRQGLNRLRKKSERKANPEGWISRG
jgi:hypothetical protein